MSNRKHTLGDVGKAIKAALEARTNQAGPDTHEYLRSLYERAAERHRDNPVLSRVLQDRIQQNS